MKLIEVSIYLLLLIFTIAHETSDEHELKQEYELSISNHFQTDKDDLPTFFEDYRNSIIVFGGFAIVALTTLLSLFICKKA